MTDPTPTVRVDPTAADPFAELAAQLGGGVVRAGVNTDQTLDPLRTVPLPRRAAGGA
ncbi:hypothetical protein [Microbacterium xylanilyticum]